MGQFDVFDNPITRARKAYPYVVVLQSDIAETGQDRIVAPTVPRARLAGTMGRLTPHIKVLGVDHVLLVPAMTTIGTTDLRDRRDDVKSHREDIVAALDYLFLGL